MVIVGAAMVTVAYSVVLFPQKSKRPVTTRPPKGKKVVSHLTIHCRDLEKSLEFYLAVGFLEVSRTSTANHTTILLSLPQGLQFAPYVLLKKITADVGIISSPDDWQCTMAGHGRMALLVPSIIRASNHLKSTLGIEPIAKPVTDMTMDREGRPMGSITIAAWTDPDGTVVELVETHNTKTRGFLYLLSTLGAFAYPLWIHCNINTTNFEESFKAYQQIGFEMASDHGRVKNKLYQALGIADPGIARRVAMIKTSDDYSFQIDLIEWEDPATVLPKGGRLRSVGLTSLALALPRGRRIDRVPVGWEAKGPTTEVILPEPLGRARVKTLLDPDGVTVEIVEYI